MRALLKTLVLIATFLVMSCGGSGGGSGASSQNPTFSAQKYAGYYLGECESIPFAFNLETGAPLHGRLYQVIASSATNAALLQWRLDLYDTPKCLGSAVGYVENKNPVNKMTIVGQTSINGKTVDKVIVNFGAPEAASIASSTFGSVVIGTAMRLSLPTEIYSAYEYADIWYVESGKLYEGAELIGADGFPIALDTVSFSIQLNAPLPLPAAPCGAKTVTWQIESSSCSAILLPRASGLVLNILDSTGPSTGTARFTCSNGEWSAAINASCSQPPPPPPSCQPTTFTWAINGNTCSGQLVEPLLVGNLLLVSASNPGYYGLAPVTCSASLELILDPRYPVSVACYPIPPPKPPTTDPLQLAIEKNCMNCHKVLTDLVGPSFKRIADYYRSSPPPVGVLEAKIKNGSGGLFGGWSMPANPQVTDADLLILVPWILSQ
jgi:cytochrome c